MAKKNKKNVGKLDRIVRTILAVTLAYISYTYLEGLWMWVLYAVAVLLLVTVFRHRCVPYDWFGINTNK